MNKSFGDVSDMGEDVPNWGELGRLAAAHPGEIKWGDPKHRICWEGHFGCSVFLSEISERISEWKQYFGKYFFEGITIVMFWNGAPFLPAILLDQKRVPFGDADPEGCRRCQTMSQQYVKINIGGEKLIAVRPDLFGILGDNQLASALSGRDRTAQNENQFEHSSKMLKIHQTRSLLVCLTACFYSFDPWKHVWRPLDSDGSYFVDYSPDVFMPLVEWLREVRDSEPNVVVPVRVKQECRLAWIRMMRAFSFDLSLLYRADIKAAEMRQVGLSAERCRAARFGASNPELIAAGFDTAQVQRQIALCLHPESAIVVGYATHVSTWKTGCWQAVKNNCDTRGSLLTTKK